MSYSKKKNLIKSRDEYTRYFGNFRGVDFSSDHTSVNEQRFAYAINMYKDYKSGEGQAVETIPGFRRQIEIPTVNIDGEIVSQKIYGIHRYDHIVSGKRDAKILIHAGKNLYLWDEYPLTANVECNYSFEVKEGPDIGTGKLSIRIPLDYKIAEIRSIEKMGRDNVSETLIKTQFTYDKNTHTLTLSNRCVNKGDQVYITYYESVIKPLTSSSLAMNELKSTSFVFNNYLYIIDGKNYLVYNGESLSKVSGYIPTTRKNIVVGGDNADTGVEIEQRNILSDQFKNTFIADGETSKYYLSERDLNSIDSVEVYGEATTKFSFNLADGYIEFNGDAIPAKPEDTDRSGDSAGKYTKDYAGVVITASKKWETLSGVVASSNDISNCIAGCTLATIFDKRVFLSGNPDYPNHVFFCGINSATGYEDPTYFGVLDFVRDGIEPAPITGMIAVADTLAVLKNHARQDGSIYFHTHYDTGKDIAPVTYPHTQGLSGIGCLGACVNFLDDPIFISRLGVEGIGQLSVRLERAIEHRSSLIDAKLVNLDLEEAVVTEWDGYLIVLVDGKIFMADSRQVYTHEIGVPQYEWYYLEGIGVYEYESKEERENNKEYYYAPIIYNDLYESETDENDNYYITDRCRTVIEDGISYEIAVADKVYDAVNEKNISLLNMPAIVPSDETAQKPNVKLYTWRDEEGNVIASTYYQLMKYGDENTVKAIICDDRGSYTGGEFKKATTIVNMDNNLFFGTENGVVCAFNFDKRDSDGMISPRWYSFDDRTIYCGIATKMDNCGVPHLNKTTVKKSTVVKTKSMISSAAKYKVRTNNKVFEQIDRVNSVMFSFDEVDFSDFSFVSMDQSLFAIEEKEKKWIEKQIFIYSDEFRKPFSIHYLAYRYKIAGRFKE